VVDVAGLELNHRDGKSVRLDRSRSEADQGQSPDGGDAAPSAQERVDQAFQKIIGERPSRLMPLIDG
jgi:hypothetical protein